MGLDLVFSGWMVATTELEFLPSEKEKLTLKDETKEIYHIVICILRKINLTNTI